jgi:hypothetical protein
MKTYAALAIALGLMVAELSYAQSAVLLEACNAIKDADKRLECLREAVKTGKDEVAKDNKSEKRLVGVIIALNTAIDSTVNFRQFQQLRLELAKELGMYKSDQGHDQTAAALISDALTAYTDAETLWSVAIRSGTTVFDVRQLEALGIWQVVNRHKIPIVRIGYQGPQPEVFNEYGFSLADGLQAISQAARAKTNDAIKSLEK